MFGKKKKKYYTPEQIANRKKGIHKTEEASAEKYQKKSAERSRSREFFQGFNN